ncbi:hypothetical protein [Croceicoccus sp. Ery15]|uniref:hypothetical protein n=1 Tax=Croceicoccus sp. Ery15 TaxID=1703338 RepID=UPI001E385A3C|nr:hypothetical protein [Croceicoccus sp. Ery15]
MSNQLKPSIKSVRAARLVVAAPAVAPTVTADFVALSSLPHVVKSATKIFRLDDPDRVEIRNLNRMLKRRDEPLEVSTCDAAGDRTD